MTKDAVSKARQSVARLPQQLAPLLEILLERNPLLKGYLDSKPRTCGTPGCRCTRGEKHQAFVLRIPEGKSARSRSVPEEVFRRLEPLASEYRRFREALAHLRRLFRETDEALRQIEESRLVDPEKELRRDDEK